MLLNLTKHQWSDIDKIYLHDKYPFKSKYQLLINGREKIEFKQLKNLNAFIHYLQTIDDIYKNLEVYNPTKDKKVFLVFDDMIADMQANKKSYSHWIIFKRKKTHCLAYVLYHNVIFKVPKTIRANSTHCFIMKISNKRKLQQIMSNHLSNSKFKDFRNHFYF